MHRVPTVRISGRSNKVSADDFAAEPGAGLGSRAFLDGLPGVLRPEALRDVARSVADAVRARKGIVWMLGGQVVKTGLSPIIVRLIERGGATCLAGNGSVAIHIGSAVLMPEVFFEALAIARNLSDGEPREFDTPDFDMIRHDRPRMTVVERPTRTGGGRGYRIPGHHEIMIPGLAWAIEEYLREE